MSGDPFRAAAEILGGGRADLAEPLVRRGLEADPDSPFGHALLALCLHHKEDVDGAEREAREAVAQGPGFPFGHYVLGLVLLKSKKVVEAEAAAMSALDLAPEDENHLALLGRVRLARKRPAEALELALRGLAVDPNDLNCLNLRVVALRELGRNAESQLAARELLARHPDDELGHIQAGLARSAVHDHDGARAHFGEALRLDPTNAALAEAFESRHPGRARLAGVAAIVAVVGAFVPWTNAAATGRCLRAHTVLLPLFLLGVAWGRPRRLLAGGAALAVALALAWAAFQAGRITEARIALAAAVVVVLVPIVSAARGI
jgi:tetratricopeptide (TPR) repeat protein